MSSESQALPQAQQLPLQELPAFVAHEQNAALCCQRGAEHRELKSKIAVSVNLWLIRDKKEDSNSEDVKDGKAMAWLFFWVRFAFFCVCGLGWWGFFFAQQWESSCCSPMFHHSEAWSATWGRGSKQDEQLTARAPCSTRQREQQHCVPQPATPRPRLGSDFFYRQHGNEKGK